MGNSVDIQLASSGEPIMEQRSADGFVDLTFRVSEFAEDEEEYRFFATADFRSRRAGFRVTVRRGMRGGFDEEMNLIREHVYHGAVTFHPVAPESDALAEALVELYGRTGRGHGMAVPVSFTAILLEQGDPDPLVDPVRIKLFAFDDPNDEDEAYFESFFHLRFADSLVFWNEKDVDFRDPLLRAFGFVGGAPPGAR